MADAMANLENCVKQLREFREHFIQSSRELL